MTDDARLEEICVKEIRRRTGSTMHDRSIADIARCIVEAYGRAPFAQPEPAGCEVVPQDPEIQAKVSAILKRRGFPQYQDAPPSVPDLQGELAKRDEEIARLKRCLEQSQAGYQRSEFDARSCPGCDYREGVFHGPCKLHARIDALSAELDAARAKGPNDDVYRHALTTISEWKKFPDTGKRHDDGTPYSYGYCYGSNGERDYMRSVADAALRFAAPPVVAPAVPAVQLNNDVDVGERARALHRVVRAMHDGECPKCHVLCASDRMVSADPCGHVCPHCGFTITVYESAEALAQFAGFMDKNLAVFEEWRATIATPGGET